MVANAADSLLDMLRALAPAFTRPGFKNFVVLFVGWIRTTGVHAVTEALVATGVAGRRHHEAFHRFFSRGSWRPDEVGRLAFEVLVKRLPQEQLRFVIDDTLVHKKGSKVYGIGSHIDPVRSSKRHRILAFGHVWVVFAVLVHLPFSRRRWALPLLLRLYRGRKECARKGVQYRKKTDLAREMLEVVSVWTGSQRVSISMDSAYCCDTVLRGLSTNIVVYGSLRGNAVLTAPATRRRPGTRGRPRVRGRTLPNPRSMVNRRAYPWLSCTATLYGKTKRARYKEVVAQWYRGSGARLLRIVVQQSDDQQMLRVFFSTDVNLTAKDVLEGYAERWGIEVCFRELKQLLGFGDSSARKRAAVERTAPFVALAYSTLVAWIAQGIYATSLATPPLRPWYPNKRGLSFSDVLRAAQRALVGLDVLDLPLEAAAETRTQTPTASRARIMPSDAAPGPPATRRTAA